MDGHMLAFLGVAALLVVTPGADMALVTKHALLRGRRSGLASAFGINVGVFVWTLASAFGIAALVQGSGAALQTLRYVSAAYLIFLGGRAILRSRQRSRAVRPRAASGRFATAAFREGVVTNLLNPKLALFYTSLLPQFIPPGESVLARSLLLGAIFNVMGVAWLCTYAVGVPAHGHSPARVQGYGSSA